MQVEYEETMPPPTGLRVMPIVGDENSQSEEEEEEEEVEESAPKQKQKRVIKQRQSLAEKERGTTIWPMARIKRIVKADKDVDMMTAEATFMVATATEYFIKHFMEEGYTKARLEKRRIVNYKDMASVVSRSDEFDFLKDLFPAPMPMSEALERRKQKQIFDENPTLHEDSVPPPGEESSDDLPPLTISTNPHFPNAIVKKPPNTHAKTSSKTKQQQEKEQRLENQEKQEEVEKPEKPQKKEKKEKAPPPPPLPVATPIEQIAPSTPKIFTGKNAPSTPHSLTTRGSARRSIVPAETPVEVEDLRAEAAQDDKEAGDNEVIADSAGDDRMDED